MRMVTAIDSEQRGEDGGLGAGTFGLPNLALSLNQRCDLRPLTALLCASESLRVKRR